MSSPLEATASPPHVFASIWGGAEILTPRVLQVGSFSSAPHGDVISILFDQATPEPGLIDSPPRRATLAARRERSPDRPLK